MGKNSEQTIGYHYRVAYHVVLTYPIDAFLEFRAAEKTAWDGRAQEWNDNGKAVYKLGSNRPIYWNSLPATGAVTSSQQIYIAAPNLFGGEKDQGGILGPVDIMFGGEDQLPNPYLESVFGNQVAAWRGFTTLVFAGGRFGAMNPMPQKPSYKIRKILKGWDAPGCWYPEKAAVSVTPSSGELIRAIATFSGYSKPSPDGVDWSAEMDPIGPNSLFQLIAAGDRYVGWDHLAAYYTTDGHTWKPAAGGLSGVAGPRAGTFFKGQVVIASGPFGLHVSTDGGGNFIRHSSPRAWWLASTAARLIVAPENLTHLLVSSEAVAANSWEEGAELPFLFGQPDCMAGTSNEIMLGGQLTSEGPAALYSTITGDVLSEQTLPALDGTSIKYVVGNDDGRWVAATDAGEILYREAGTWKKSESTFVAKIQRICWADGRFFLFSGEFNANYVIASADGGETWTPMTFGGSVALAVAGGVVFDTRHQGLLGMNPAHALYYVRTGIEKGREPRANINDASLRAGADQLYSEGFGLCWEYDPARDTPDSFEQRICRIIGGSFERSLTDGQWYLDLARGGSDIEAMPIIGDADILEFKELPTTLDRAVNSVAVRYFDVERKESVITPAVRALGLIRRFGEIHETLDFPEIPVGSLALRVADREAHAYVTPTRTFELVTTPRLKTLRRNQYFRLQSPKRGIADMVCIVGSKEHGTLRSGAIRWKVSQDVYSLPDTSYIEIEEGVDTTPPATPVPIEHAKVFEAPYIDLCAVLPRSELEQLPVDVGYAFAAAASPGVGLNYVMCVQSIDGDYRLTGSGEWCPDATAVSAYPAEFGPTVVALDSVSGLENIGTGGLVIWDDEWCRLDALDIDTREATLGRGCADTVPQAHAAGSRLWFFVEAAASRAEYTDGEQVNVKLLPETGSAQLPLDSATAIPLEFGGRQARPYPPAGLLVNGEEAPDTVVGEITLTWVHRDRVLQGDQLVDQATGGIGPEAGTTYNVRWHLNSALVHSEPGITGTTASYTPLGGGLLRIELESERDGLVSWQVHVRQFVIGTALTTEAGELITTEEGQPIFME